MALSGADVLAARLDDWRLVLGALRAHYGTGGYDHGLRLVAAIGEVAAEVGLTPDVDLRSTGVGVVLFSVTAGGVTEDHVDLARRISRVAARHEATADPGALTVLELGLDTADHARISPFWAAMLGYSEVPHDATDLVDPSGRLPAIWFQPTERHPEPRQRFHLDVWVPHDLADARIAAALRAGGTLVSDEYAPSFWILADADGNKACVCTWQQAGQEPA